jgi:hypothetical protein
MASLTKVARAERLLDLSPSTEGSPSVFGNGTAEPEDALAFVQKLIAGNAFHDPPPPSEQGNFVARFVAPRRETSLRNKDI